MKTCTCERVAQKDVMQPGGGQIEFQSWKAILVLLLQILLRIAACLVGIPVVVVNLCNFQKPGDTFECHSCLVRRLLVEEETTSYTNPLFAQDWTSESFCEEEISSAEKMTSERDQRIVHSAKDRQPVSQRRKAVLPVQAVARKKPPPKPQRVWR